jgi:hypothetical protein
MVYHLRFYLLRFICVMTKIIIGADVVVHNNCQVVMIDCIIKFRLIMPNLSY